MVQSHPTEPTSAGEAFLSVLSHELRTPITTIYAGSSVLARERSLSSTTTRSLARDISVEAARLYDRVEDLLVLARLERGILDPIGEPVLLQRAVDAAIRGAVHQDDRAIIVRTGDVDPPPIWGDATYVAQACRNLIGPVVREEAPAIGTSVTVDVRADELQHEVGVRVLDRGRALDAAELAQAFTLAPGETVGRPPASGLGPFVCRQLVEAMGGRTWARNRPDGGVEIGFALPMLDATV